MTSPHRLAGAIALALICLAPYAHAVDADGLRGAVDAAVKPLMAAYDLPGMAVGVTVDGKTSYFNYGVASREHKTPVTEHTIFELGSVSKTFTATLALAAQAENRLSLQDHPGKYMPQLAGSAVDQATLLELGTYTGARLPLQVPDEVETDAQLYAWLRAWQPGAAPGTRRVYSNGSIGLLGRATALAMHADVRTLAEQRLFPALGLKETYVHVPESAMAHYAWGYNKANKPVRVNPGMFDQEAYGVKSTASDMLRYLQDNIDPAPLPPPFALAVQQTHTAYYNAGPMTQGLGWEQYAYPVAEKDLDEGNNLGGTEMPVQRLDGPGAPRIPAGPTLFNKTGATGGFGAYALFIPARRIGIVMLANKNYPNSERVKAAYAILRQFDPDLK